MQCLCPYVTARVPLFPPRRNKKRLHGCSPFQGGGGWVRHHHRSYVLRTLRKATREEGGIGFHSFQLLQWVGGKSIPFIVARCGHLLQTAASPAVLILQCWSRRKKTDIPDTKQPSWTTDGNNPSPPPPPPLLKYFIHYLYIMEVTLPKETSFWLSPYPKDVNPNSIRYFHYQFTMRRCRYCCYPFWVNPGRQVSMELWFSYKATPATLAALHTQSWLILQFVIHHQNSGQACFLSVTSPLCAIMICWHVAKNG